MIIHKILLNRSEFDDIVFFSGYFETEITEVIYIFYIGGTVKPKSDHLAIELNALLQEHNSYCWFLFPVSVFSL